jgi:hypothetical protein
VRRATTVIGRRAVPGALAAAALPAARAQIADVNEAINKAGRQRMLSQRMAKFRLAQRWQVALPEAAQELAPARDGFVAALPVLRDALEATPAMRAELELAQQQWVFFDIALRSTEASRRLARDVFASSENILAVMDRVTGLYARAAAA